jgi:hypothetical protein
MCDMWNLASFSLETELVSVQDMYTVCAKRTMHLIVLLVNEAQVDTRFGPF